MRGKIGEKRESIKAQMKELTKEQMEVKHDNETQKRNTKHENEK
jgi:hypothetical protein